MEKETMRTRKQIEQDTKSKLDISNVLSDWVEEHYGVRCPDFEEECAVCTAWELYDRLVQDKDLVQNKTVPKCRFCKDTRYLKITEQDGTITDGRCPQCYTKEDFQNKCEGDKK